MVWAWTSYRVQTSFHAPCRTGVDSNSIFCNGCKHWVHKKCSRLKCLTKDLDYRCTWSRELHTSLTADHRAKSVGPDKLEVVASFCYLGDMLTAAGGCELPTTKKSDIYDDETKPQLPSKTACAVLYKNTGVAMVNIYKLHVSKPYMITCHMWSNLCR